MEPTLTDPPRPKRRSLIADVEWELREHGNPYVSVDEAKNALFQNAKLRAFHFVVYDRTNENWLLWCGDPDAVVRADMANWKQVFGDGYQVVYALRRAGRIIYKTASGARLTLNGESASAAIPQVGSNSNSRST